MPAPTSFWNQPLPRSVPIDPNSASYVSALMAQGAETAFGINYRDWAKTVFFANENDPKVAFTIDQPHPLNTYFTAMAEQLAAVPMPAAARPPGPWASQGDNHLIVIVRKKDGTFDEYNFWRARQFEVDGKALATQEPVEDAVLKAPGWHCQAGVKVTDAGNAPGYTTDPNLFSATASGLSLLGGLITVDEARRGYIPHALSFTAIKSKIAAKAPTGVGPRWPAVKTDGQSADPLAVQEGMIFTLKEEFDPNVFSDTFLRACATAIKVYGAVVNDASSTTVALNAENRCTTPGSQSEQKDGWKGTEDKFGGPGAVFSKFVGGAGGLIEQLFTTIAPYLQVVDASHRPSSVARGFLGKTGT